MNNGVPFPFGAIKMNDGVNFAIYAKSIKKMALCLYDENQLKKPFKKFVLNPIRNKTGSIWHIWIKDLPDHFGYLYEVTNADNVTHKIIDPYAKALISDPHWHTPARKHFSYKPMGKFFIDDFNWENDTAPNLPKKNLIIYEMHVRGFTQHPSSHVKCPGTFKGMIEKIPHLLDIGVNAVELMPIQEFCEEDTIQINPENHKKLHNYFGYSTVNFFSPMNRYASESYGNKAVTELKELVKELHKNKIEVILDIVFNHTSEGNEKGPTLSFKALDLPTYYLVNSDNQFLNFSGCGNTVNSNHPITRELIIDALRYWVLEYHIDGFRFDLASAFNRGKDGMVLDYSSMIELISLDPVLSSKKIIAEPWDAGGLYQLGKFASNNPRWSEWNGKYQSTVKNFIKGSSHFKSSFAGALSGSHDVFSTSPYCSINYIVTHDGFNLADSVSYNEKHNLVNGENNQDGLSSCDSWNCGIEGETNNKKILNLRKRQMRNLHLALMVSQGIPMVYLGDEYGHTKRGNNNPWGQDNEINWFLWDQLEKEKDFFRFYKSVIHFRKNCPLLKMDDFLTDKEIHWHGLHLNQPEWDVDNKIVAFSLHFPNEEPGLYIAFNASHLYQTFEIPPLPLGKFWKWIVNTHNPSPTDFFDENQNERLTAEKVRVGPYSSVMLQAK